MERKVPSHSALGLRCPDEDTCIADTNAAKARVKAGILVGVIEHQPARSGGALAYQFAIVRAPLCLTQHVPSGECRTLELCIRNKTRSLEYSQPSVSVVAECSLRKNSSFRENANRQQAEHELFCPDG